MQARKQMLEPVSDPNKFDLVVDRWDSQGHRTGPRKTYRKFINGDGEFYERPVGSGNLWLENNQPAGRVIYKTNEAGHIYDKKFDFDAKHIDWSPAPTGAEKVAAELASERAKNAQLEAELRAILKEREPQATKSVPKLSKE